jgi:hypothetical protein
MLYKFDAEPLCDEFELDTDDEEEVYEVDDEVVNLSEDDGGVQADEEDAECPDIRVVDKIDPELQYEICETALGDCGCVTGPDAVKRRCVNMCFSVYWYCLPYYISYTLVATRPFCCTAII